MKRRYRVLLTILSVALVIAALLAVFYAAEDWRGARHWEDARRQSQSKGTSLNPTDYIPLQVPDDQNIAMAPVFVRLYQYRVDPQTGALTFNKEGNANAAKEFDALPYGDKDVKFTGNGGCEGGQAVDLAAYQRFYAKRPDFPHATPAQTPAADVLLALSRFDPLLHEIDEAFATRQFARFPVNWTQRPPMNIMLPHYNLAQKVAAVLKLRACAELKLGRSDDAFRDVMFGFRLRRMLVAEPMLIAHLVDITCLGMLTQPIWEGLREHRWTTGQLEKFRRILEGIDLVEGCRRACESDLAVGILPTADYLRETGTVTQEIAQMQGKGHESNPWVNAASYVFPRGWYDEAKANLALRAQEYIIDPIDTKHRVFDAKRIDAGDELTIQTRATPKMFLVKLCMPVYPSILVKAAHCQAVVDEAAVACGLERLQIEHAVYPRGPGRVSAAVP